MAALTEPLLRQQVERFYEKVRKDRALGPIFADNVADWPEHLDRMTDFWTSIMLTSGRYKGDPFAAHLPFVSRLNEVLFERWLELWRQTAHETFGDEAASQLQHKAERVAGSLMSGLFRPIQEARPKTARPARSTGAIRARGETLHRTRA